MSYSEDNSSRESFASSDMDGINLTSDRQGSSEFSRLCRSSFSYEPKMKRTKKVSFMIGDDLLEEMGEDAFHHDYDMSNGNDNTEYDHTVDFSYNTDDSWRDIKFLADQLENKVSFYTFLTYSHNLIIIKLSNTLAILLIYLFL